MQGVYYLPREVPVKKDQETNLVSCQDEYSLWFYIDDKNDTKHHYKRPICECGVHMAWSRTHVSYLNDKKQSRRHIKQLKQEVANDSVVLDLNGSSFLGLIAAKMAKKVYIHETSQFNIKILADYIERNGITNVEFVPEITEVILKEVTNITCDPVRSSSILPWEDLKCAYILQKHKEFLKGNVSIIPKSFELWAMPVEFLDLHKIRVPVLNCEGFDVSHFDQLVEVSVCT